MSTALEKAPPAVVAVFSRPRRLSVRQRKRWLEILTSLDAPNTYVVFDETGDPVLSVQEQGKGFGSFLKRMFLGAFRPFTSRVEDLQTQQLLLRLERPFRLFFHRLEVFGPDGERIGAIQRRWTWFRRRYTVENGSGAEIATLFGPILRPWTFEIQLPGSDAEVGVVQKRWGGLAKELFTEADNFGVTFEQIQDPALRALLFSATVLIDIVHFERSG